ncbi:hypothetical protein EDB84DRAFT_1499437 [Lactarius hengduanensis]|nr:hypothetical protein EDB84DRAFT_1499437 [Lactarius hengduanensis]
MRRHFTIVRTSHLKFIYSSLGISSDEQRAPNFTTTADPLLPRGASLSLCLQIVDASVLQYVPVVHPQAVLYTIAERAAKLIAAD